MRKWLLVLALVIVPSMSFGQSEGNTILLKFAGVPAGTCSFIMLGLNSANGNVYSCPAGSWVLAGGGGAGGTVTNTGGALTANAVVLGAGGNDTKVSTGITTNGASELDVGVNGGAGGVIGWNGATSGKATCTAPAVAGTAANPLVCTNAFSSAGAYAMTGSASLIAGTTGTSCSGNCTTNFDAYINGTEQLFINASQFDPKPPVCDFATGNNCVTFAANSIAVTGTGTANGQVERGFNVNVTPVTVSANVTTDQNLMAVTIPANNLNVVTRTFRVFVAGVYSTPAASVATITLELKLCSVSGCGSGNVMDLIDITSSANPGTVTNNAFNLTAYFTTQTAGAASRFEAHGIYGIDLGALTTAADTFFSDTNTAVIAGTPADIDTTAQNFLQVAIAFSVASASNSATERQLVVELVN